jgi:hypothetical protein
VADNMQATPQKRPIVGALAQLLKNVDEFGRKPFGYDNPPGVLLSDLFGVPGTQRTLERLAYGEALTEPRGVLKSDTTDALFNLPGPLAKLAMMTKGLPVGAAIKPKGGNWLAGSVEDSVKGLKRKPTLIRPDESLPDELRARVLAENAPIEGLNSWVDKQLTRYIKNEMATPEDPVRALAEKGVLHYAPTPTPGSVQRAGEHRIAGGYPAWDGLGKSELARDYETLTDASIGGHKAGDWMANASDKVIEANPWLSKIPPESVVYEKVNPSLSESLGFDHLIDELRNATNPASGLPPELLLKYSSLPQVSVPQAVERVAKINEWRAAQKAEADFARASNAATVLHKEYPDKGFKWVELKQGEQLPEGWRQDVKGQYISPEGKFTSRNPNETALQDALKYEGDTMGHCVGGYCDDVASGKSRIYSLRDAKGQPHTTIEVAPKLPGSTKSQLYYYDLANEGIASGAIPVTRINGRVPMDEVDRVVAELKQTAEAPSESIIQIKGKGNKAPNPEYLPYVQDFVKSGKWSDVGDLRNAGLVKSRDLNHAGIAPDEFDAFIARHGEYATPDEAARLRPDPQGLDDGAYGGNMEPEGFARGGSVTTKDPIRLMAEKYAAHCPSLRNHALHKGN